MITKTSLLKSLFVAALSISAAHVSASTNKTYLAPRPVGQNLAGESIAIADLARHAKKSIGGTLEATAFYNTSQDKTGLGKAFGVENKSGFSAAPGTTADLNSDVLIPNYGGTAFGSNSIEFKPTEQTYGMVLNYHQDLHKIMHGLFVTVNLPLVTVVHNMNMSIKGDNVNDFQDFFNGTLMPVAINASNARGQLTNALIDGSNSCSKIADLDLRVGYNFVDKEETQLAGTALISIPAGNKPQGVHVWEAVAGNGGHVALGLGANLTTRAWGNRHENINLIMGVDYRYTLEAVERRTFGIKGIDFGQYNAIGLTAGYKNAQQLIPAANALTLDARITPRSSFESILGFTYNRKNLALTLGYNLFYRGEGKAELLAKWDDTKYKYISKDTDMSAASALVGTALTKDSIDTSSATSLYFSQKAYGEIAHTFKNEHYPVVLAAGAHYEFAGSNSATENWGFNFKTGISF